MKIHRVLVDHFRSIKNLEFYPANICALVGENNAGKTNVLAALNFLLGESWPSRRGLDATDYYNQDTSRPIRIEVEFEDNLDGIERVWCEFPWDSSGETKYTNRGSSREHYLSNPVREKCALVYLDANRNLEYHLGYSRWTLFGRIVRQLDADFRETVPASQQRALDDCFHQARDLLRTTLYQQFEVTFKSAFTDQLKRTTHILEVDFHTFDPLNYYRSLQPLLLEDGKSKHPSEAGQGMRNLILLALFRAYAKVFKSDAIIAVEEPEIYLHPHAQRSLSALFDDLAGAGNQIFYSTHSGNFINVEHFDRICLVEKCKDSTDELCTEARQVFVHQLLAIRQKLHPNIPMNGPSLRERYRNICDLEHNEAFFARKIVLVEGETEEYALPIYAKGLGDDYDANGISVVNAHGKNNLDQFYQLYTAFELPVYLIFDNDRGGKPQDLIQNEVLLRMLDEVECREPDGIVTDTFTILEGNFEKEVKTYLESVEPGKYDSLSAEASTQLGQNAGKGLIARFMAQRLTNEGLIPPFIKSIVNAVRTLSSNSPSISQNVPALDDDVPFDDDDVPF